MKTKNVLLTFLCLLFLFPLIAQQDDLPVKKIRIHVVKDENGKQKVIDKEFNSEAELEKFIKANKEEFPEPPVPPTPPLPPVRPFDEATAIQQGCKRVTNIDKKIELGKVEEKIIIRHVDENDVLLTEDILKMLGDDKAEVEKIIIIRKSVCDDKKPQSANEVKMEEYKGPSHISDLNFYPNPNQGNFYVRFRVSEPTDVELQITALNGKVVYTDEAKNFSGLYEKNIYREELESGTYMMQVRAGEERKTLKISVQK